MYQSVPPFFIPFIVHNKKHKFSSKTCNLERKDKNGNDLNIRTLEYFLELCLFLILSIGLVIRRCTSLNDTSDHWQTEIEWRLA